MTKPKTSRRLHRRIAYGLYGAKEQYYITGVDGTIAQLGKNCPPADQIPELVERADREHRELLTCKKKQKSPAKKDGPAALAATSGSALVCSRCGGIKEVRNTIFMDGGYDDMMPCPQCQPPPPASNCHDPENRILPIMKTGIELIAEERHRQIVEEGWTPEHDSHHSNCELTAAAFCYIEEAAQQVMRSHAQGEIPEEWPWSTSWWKPGDPIRNLTKAGALIAAEIDRLQKADTPDTAAQLQTASPTLCPECGSIKFHRIGTHRGLIECSECGHPREATSEDLLSLPNEKDESGN